MLACSQVISTAVFRAKTALLSSVSHRWARRFALKNLSTTCSLNTERLITLQDFGGCGLLFERFAARSVQQPCVLDRDHGLFWRSCSTNSICFSVNGRLVAIAMAQI